METSQNAKPFLTDREIADFLGVHVATARRYMKEGRIPGEKLGQQWLCRRGVWDRYIAGEWQAAS